MFDNVTRTDIRFACTRVTGKHSYHKVAQQQAGRKLVEQSRPRADEVMPGLGDEIAREMDHLEPRWPRDLPAGVMAMWDIAFCYARPTTTMEPVRYYGDPNNVAILPVLATGQTTTVVAIPTTAALVGMEFYGQSVAFPQSGQPWMPPYHLPRGQRITPRM